MGTDRDASLRFAANRTTDPDRPGRSSVSDERKSVDRREFLRKAAITGAAAAWAAPVIQTVAATPAFAQTAGTPAVCDHSACVAACNTNSDCRGQPSPDGSGNLCEYRCRNFCPPGSPCPAACTAAGLCVAASDAGSAWASTCQPSDCGGASGGQSASLTTRVNNLHA